MAEQTVHGRSRGDVVNLWHSCVKFCTASQQRKAGRSGETQQKHELYLIILGSKAMLPISHTEDAVHCIVQVKPAISLSPQRYLSNTVKLESLFQCTDPLHLSNPVWL